MAGPGIDVLRGGDGDDIVSGGFGADLLEGGAGGDALSGDRDHDTLLGGPGDDVLHRGSGIDRIDGGPGADRIFADSGGDFISGGAGDDVIVVDAAVPAHVRCGTGRDTVYLTVPASATADYAGIGTAGTRSKDCEIVEITDAVQDPNRGLTYLAPDAGGARSGTARDDVLLGGQPAVETRDGPLCLDPHGARLVRTSGDAAAAARAGPAAALTLSLPHCARHNCDGDGESSNGRTRPFEGRYPGSNPGSPVRSVRAAWEHTFPCGRHSASHTTLRSRNCTGSQACSKARARSSQAPRVRRATQSSRCR